MSCNQVLATAAGGSKETLPVALDLAAKGYRVFPLVPNGKLPAIKGWPEKASFDPKEVRAMWIDRGRCNGEGSLANFNVGIATGPTREGYLLVLDVDVKNGKQGLKSLASLDMLATDLWLDTKRVRTGTGGDHYYFLTERPLSNSVSKLGCGLDTRGEGGYVVAAGSTVDGKPYIDLGGSERQIPAWLSDMIGQTVRCVAPQSLSPDCTLDTEQAIARAKHFLKFQAEIAVEGSGGNLTTYRVAAHVKDFGVSQNECCNLMVEDWNDRCSPPWDRDELSTVIGNAYKFGKKPIGILSPESFAAVEPCDRVPSCSPPASRDALRSLRPGYDTLVRGDQLMAMQFEDVRWIAEGLIPEGLTILAGAPKIGKSWLVSELATATATNGKLCGSFFCPKGAVLMLALEDNLRRIQSRFRKMDAEVTSNIAIRTLWRRLSDGGVDDIAAWLDANPDARLVIIDTLAKVKPRPNRSASNYDNDSDALAPLQRLALERHIAVVLVHHDRKAKDPDDWLNQISGTLGLSGVADTVILLRRPRGASKHAATLNVTGREVEETKIGLTFDPDNGRWRMQNSELDDFDASPEQNEILQQLKSAGKAGKTSREISQENKKTLANVCNMLSRLKDHGAVCSPKRGLWTIAE